MVMNTIPLMDLSGESPNHNYSLEWCHVLIVHLHPLRRQLCRDNTPVLHSRLLGHYAVVVNKRNIYIMIIRRAPSPTFG